MERLFRLTALFLVFASACSEQLNICQGRNISVNELPKFSKRNCSVIEGPLVLHASHPSLNTSEVKQRLRTPLTTVVEITSVLMVTGLDDGVTSIGQILPNLAVIRGNPSYHVPNFSFGLRVFGNKYLEKVELNKLTHSLGKDSTIGFWDNAELKFYRTVNWERISISGKRLLANGNDKGDCSNGICQADCSNHKYCWNETECQIVYNGTEIPNCSRDMGNAFRISSESECQSFCKMEGKKLCVSCKHFYYNGKCIQKCSENTFEHAGWRCVDQCPNITLRIPQGCSMPTFAFKQSCQMECPKNYTGDDETRECLPCSESCEKRCPGGTIRNLMDAKRFEGCIRVEGSLTIASVEGVNENKLEDYLGQIKIVDDYVNISFSYLSSLSFLKSLTMIKGKKLGHIEFNFDLFHLTHALIIMNNTKLKSIDWENQTKLCLGGRIDASIVILNNPCLSSDRLERLMHQFPEIVVERGNDDSNNCDNETLLVEILSSSLAGLLLLTMFVVFFLFRLRRQKKQLEMNCEKYLSIIHEEQSKSLFNYTPDEWEISRDEITLEVELGAGAFGSVYVGSWQRNDGKEPLKVAVKTVHEQSCHQDKMEFLHEASVMKHFQSCHVVRLLGIVSQCSQVLVVMELMTKGDLKSYLRSLEPESHGPFTKNTFPLSQDDMLQIVCHIAAGMAYLTDLKFVHRDLAARNCMVTDRLTVKIGDFGLARDIYDSDYYRKVGRGPLPVRWMPPESLKYGVFSHASDIWSFGIVLWEVAMLGTQPYPGISNEDVYKFVTGGGFMNISDINHVPNEYKLLMERCWLFKPNSRLSFQVILQCIGNTSEQQLE